MALYLNAATFAFSAFTIYKLRELPKGPAAKGEVQTSVMRSLVDGWKFVGSNKAIRGLVLGMLGAFVAAGAVVGLARIFVGDLGGGEAAYGILLDRFSLV